MNESIPTGTLWRYLTFSKFVSLLELRALWMSRLGNLIDEFEGTLPRKTKEAMDLEALQWPDVLPQPELQEQFATMTQRNVDSGREVLVVNCWCLAEGESQRMWDQYVGSLEGVAIRSSMPRLDKAIPVKEEFTLIERVQYIDFDEHDMGTYLGNQAHQRALLKRPEYSFESEVRIVTMNIVGRGCLNADGSHPTETQQKGPGVFDPARPGLYLQVDLATLIEAVVTAPNSAEWFHDLVSRVCKRYGIQAKVEKSVLTSSSACAGAR